MSEKPIFVTAKVPQQLKTEIREAVKTGRYMNESDFLRCAARSELEKNKKGTEG